MYVINRSKELNPSTAEEFIKANHEDVAFPLGKVAILRMREDVGRILDGLLKIGEKCSTVEWSGVSEPVTLPLEGGWTLTLFSTKEEYRKVPASTEIRNTLVSDLYQLFSGFAFSLYVRFVCVYKVLYVYSIFVQIVSGFRFQM